MNTYEEAIQRIKSALTRTADPNHEQLRQIAAEMIVSGWQHGYCEVTEHEVVHALVKDIYCHWCGKLHYDSDAPDAVRHAKLSAIPLETYQKLFEEAEAKLKAEGNESYHVPSSERLAEEAGLLK